MEDEDVHKYHSQISDPDCSIPYDIMYSWNNEQ